MISAAANRMFCQRRNIIILAQTESKHALFSLTNKWSPWQSIQFRFSLDSLCLDSLCFQYIYIDRIESRWPSTFNRKYNVLKLPNLLLERRANANISNYNYAIDFDEFRWKNVFFIICWHRKRNLPKNSKTIQQSAKPIYYYSTFQLVSYFVFGICAENIFHRLKGNWFGMDLFCGRKVRAKKLEWKKKTTQKIQYRLE